MAPNSPPVGIPNPSSPHNTTDDDQDGFSESTSVPNSHSLAGSYRRPSSFIVGSRGTVVSHPQDQERSPEWERQQALGEERDLLSDNNVIEPESRHQNNGTIAKKVSGLLSQRRKTLTGRDEESNFDTTAEPSANSPASETTALLVPAPSTGRTADDAIDQKWEEAVMAGLIHTTWRREVKVITKYSTPLMVSFVLQYSLTVASIFTVGHIGKVELGAVSLASMTANITGYALYQGLATSLDTLCAQAYGSGKKQLVGLQMQRMIFFLWTLTIPIGLIWFFADKILMAIVPEKDVAVLAGQYLKVLILGAPGYACFESGKRYVQAQGLFSAALYVLLIGAPLNAFMNWLLVWVCSLSS